MEKYGNPDLWYDLITPESGGIRLDLDQRVFLRSLSRFISTYGVMPRGYGKCVRSGTMIFTEDGIKEIDEFFGYIKPKKEFYIKNKINLLNRYGDLETSHTGVYSGYQSTKEIITEEGYEIGVTPNHPLLVMRNGKLEWVEADKILVGDYIPISRGNNAWGSNTKLSVNVEKTINKLNKSIVSKERILKNKCNAPKELTKELALIMGYLIGDGGLTLETSISLTNIDEDIIRNFKNFMENVMQVEVSKSDITYSVYGYYIREYFNQIGLDYSKSNEKRVPKQILSAPKEIVAAFIRGLFDTDGGLSNSYIQYSTASKKLSEEIQVILLNFGIVSTRTKSYNKKFKTHSYRINIYGKNMDLYLNEIGFSCSRKQKKLIELCNVKRNPNKDIIPHQKELVKRFFNSYKKYDNKPLYHAPNGKPRYLSDELYHILKGSNELTYKKLSLILSLPNSHLCEGYEKLKELFDLNYFFSKVKSVEETKEHVYDLSLPKTNSFVSNGFISHNTFLEMLGMYHTAIFYPDIEISMTAQTKENAASLAEEKHREIIKFYPLIKNEIVSASFTKDSVEIVFTSGGIIDTLANAQSTKGARRKRLNVEEAAQLNAELFDDVLEPVVNIPRRTIGKKAEVNPEELNGQINFFTTSWFRGTDEFERNIMMVDQMANLEGRIVLGSDWQLACHYNRGEPKSQILEKKEKLSPTFFAMNYESRWVGSVDGSLVDINKVMDLRTLASCETSATKKGEYIISMDVARSNKDSNNQSSIAILKLNRGKSGKVSRVKLVNLINLPTGLNFTAQTIELKKIAKLFNAKVVIVDGNGLGSAVVDEAMKENIDPLTGEILDCWDTINNDKEPEVKGADKIIYDLHSQGINSDIIINFIDIIESKKLQLLMKNDSKDYDINDSEYIKNNVLPFVQTDLLLEEIANLKLKRLPSGKYTIEQVTKKIDKDRYSAVAYGLWYIKEFEDKQTNNNVDLSQYVFYN